VHRAAVRNIPRMDEGPVRLTRESLYEIVWAKPMTHLAAELGVQASILVEACRQLDVPRPGSGYWTRLAYGQRPSRPSLDPRPEGSPHEIELAKPRSGSAGSAPVVQVRTTLRNAHPAVETLRNLLVSDSPDRDGMHVVRGESYGAIVRVTDATRDRALRLLDALGRSLAERGHALRCQAPQRMYGSHALEVDVAGEVVALAIVEPMKQRTHVPTPAEVETQRRSGWSFAPRFDHVPSGQLVLRLHAPYGAARRSTWADRTNQRLEDLLGRVVLAIEEAAVTIREQRREERERERVYQEERARRARAEHLAQHQKALGDDLINMATGWSRAESVREFLSAVEEAVPAATRCADFTAWLAWARSFQRSLDPLGRPDAIAKRLEPPPESAGDASPFWSSTSDPR